MIRRPLAALLFLFAGATAGVAGAAPAAPDAAMLAPVQRWIDAYNSGSALPEDDFTSDVVITDEFPPFVWSGKAGEHRWAQAINGFIRPGKQHVAVGAAQSFHAAHDRVSFVLPATLSLTSSRTGKVVTENALWLFVLARDGDRWRIAADTWTAAQPPARAPATGSITVPLRQERGVLLFEAMIDGVGPLLFTLDPGGDDVYTSYARARLKGRTPKTVCVAHACVAAAMRYVEGDPNSLDPQHDPASGILAGSLGPQLFRKYAIRIDYRNSRLTLIPTGRFQPAPGGRALTLALDAYGMPVTRAQVDGVAAPFELDVRVGTSMLFGPFLNRTGLRRTYGAAPVVKRSGRLEARAVQSVMLGGVELRDVPFWFGNATSGKFANPEAGGLLANDVLAHFVVTFDVPERKVFLEPA